jgi:hypothetical protein
MQEIRSREDDAERAASRAGRADLLPSAQFYMDLPGLAGTCGKILEEAEKFERRRSQSAERGSADPVS